MWQKIWKSSLTSFTEESLSPDNKKIKLTASFTHSEASGKSEEVLIWSNIAEMIMPKPEQVLEKLQKLEDYIKAVDGKVSSLQAKVECFKSFKKKTKKE